MAVRLQVRRDTAAQWLAENPVLADGEPGYEKDTGKQKYGDGVTAWDALPYFAGDSNIEWGAIPASPPVTDQTDLVAYIAGQISSAVAAALQGLKWKSPSVRARTTGALPSYSVSGGNTILTATANGAFPAQDGITLLVNEHLLVANEATQSRNGIYVLTQVGNGSTPWILTRRSDADTASKLQGAVIRVDEGTGNADTSWIQTTDNITLGSSNIVWGPFGTNVPDADASVKGIMKKYGTVGSNSDGTIDQATISSALNNKSDSSITTASHAGSYALTSTELAAVNAGQALLVEGDASGDLTVPTNASVAFGIGKMIAVRGYNNVVAAGGVTIVGDTGTLALSAGQTGVLEKTGTNTWRFHNGGGGGVVAAWTALLAGTVERSTQAEAEDIITKALAGSTTGLSDSRTPSEIGFYYFLLKIQAVASSFLSWLGIGPVRVAASINGSNVMALDAGNAYYKKWVMPASAGVRNSAFSITISNKSNLETGHIIVPVNGTFSITITDNDMIAVTTDFRWTNTTSPNKLLGVNTGATDRYIEIGISRVDASFFLARITDYYPTS
ncbi:MAG: hypothetical protein QM762_12710 [Chryseolinea sp.]